jgi:hypothetical protein
MFNKQQPHTQTTSTITLTAHPEHLINILSPVLSELNRLQRRRIRTEIRLHRIERDMKILTEAARMFPLQKLVSVDRSARGQIFEKALAFHKLLGRAA